MCVENRRKHNLCNIKQQIISMFFPRNYSAPEQEDNTGICSLILESLQSILSIFKQYPCYFFLTINIVLVLRTVYI